MNIRTAHNYINQKVAFLGFYSLSGPFAFCSSQSVFSQHFPSILLAVCIPCSIEFVRIDINFVYIYICVYRPTQPVDGPFDCWVGTSTVEPGKRQKSGSRKVTAQGKVKKWKKNWTRTKNNLQTGKLKSQREAQTQKHGQNFSLCSLNGLCLLANLRFSHFAFITWAWKVSTSAAKKIGGTFAGFMIRSLKAFYTNPLASLTWFVNMCEVGGWVDGWWWYHFRFIKARTQLTNMQGLLGHWNAVSVTLTRHLAFAKRTQILRSHSDPPFHMFVGPQLWQ